MKNLNVALAKWSRETYEDIFKEQAIREEVVKIKETLFEEEPSMHNRIVLHKAQAELKKYLYLEEKYWRQKAGLQWFTEGDDNTAFFHNHVKGKRQKLQLHRIKDRNGGWIETNQQILEEAVHFVSEPVHTRDGAQQHGHFSTHSVND